MQVTYELTKTDFVEAVKAHRNRSAFTKWFPRVFAGIVLASAWLGLLQLAFGRNSQTLSNFAPLFVLAVIWAGLIWGHPWLIVKRIFMKQPSLQGPRTLLLDEAGVHLAWTSGKSDLEWNNFVRKLEGKNQFLLYTSPVFFLAVVPKRAFTPGQLSEFRTVLAQNLPRHR
jgi:hypothetical protein